MGKKLKGIGASSGIAIGDIFLFKKEEIKISLSKTRDVKKEITLVNNAFKKAISQLNNLKKIAITRIGHDKAMVFDAHIQILKDPEISNQIISKIQDENINGLLAIKEVFDTTKTIFESMEDLYFKERASDIEDVKTRVMYAFRGEELPNLLNISKKVIIVAHDLTPSETALLNKKYVKGFVTDLGGRTSHAAIIARTLEIPAVLGLKNITNKISNVKKLALNGDLGIVELDPKISQWENDIKRNIELKNKYEKFKNKSATTIDGKNFLVKANIGTSVDVDNISKYGAEGVGLFRSEFLYMDNSNWPSEEQQFESYKYVLSKNHKHLTVIRTLDIGGDKHLDYFKFPKEDNPSLGYRAIRLCLDKKEIFRIQIRALARASQFGKLAIMFPMITTIKEFIDAKKFTIKCINEVKKEGYVVSDNIQIGMMIEVPAAAIIADKFAKYADFFSIGTNDLIQYSMAADRTSQSVSYLYQPLNPSILKLIESTIIGANKYNRWVCLCGEMASDVLVVPVLLGLGNKGINTFSMNAASIPRTKYLISRLSQQDCVKLANKVLGLESADQVKNCVSKFLKSKKIDVK